MSVCLYVRPARALALLFAGSGGVASAHGPVDSSTLTGKVMFGDQDSFNAQGDGAQRDKNFVYAMGTAEVGKRRTAATRLMKRAAASASSSYPAK